MPQPKPFTTDATWRKGDRKDRVAVLDTTPRKNVRSDGTRPFIAPLTREQLMVGSANLRRVYKAGD